MKRMTALILLAAAVLATGAAGADTEVRVSRLAPSADMSLPFWCDWSYDWEARCYREDEQRLPIGGDDDKVWRAALRFPLEAIPRGAVVVSATLYASFDGVCLGPRKTERPCPQRTYTIDVHPIFTEDWLREREVDIGPSSAQGSFWAGTKQRLSWDLTDQVISWIEAGAPNHGLLLKLAEGEEDLSVSGPKLPSSRFGAAALRPMLEVSYMAPP
jgi:hypothetical protein